jgi:hypothetical protein
MSDRGPYDQTVENIEITQIHLSNKDREFEIEVADGIHETRVNSTIEKRKQQIWNS